MEGQEGQESRLTPCVSRGSICPPEALPTPPGFWVRSSSASRVWRLQTRPGVVCLLWISVHRLIFPAYPSKPFPHKLDRSEAKFLCWGGKRGREAGRLQTRLNCDLVRKQRCEIRPSSWMSRFPHSKRQLHDLGPSLWYPVLEQTPERGVQLQKTQPEDCPPHVTSPDWLLSRHTLCTQARSQPFLQTS